MQETSYIQIQEKVQYDDEEVHEQQPYNIATGRGKRVRRSPQRFVYLVNYALVAEDLNNSKSCSYEEIVSCDESSQWLKAMTNEIESLHKNQTWELVKLPQYVL